MNEQQQNIFNDTLKNLIINDDSIKSFIANVQARVEEINKLIAGFGVAPNEETATVLETVPKPVPKVDRRVNNLTNMLPPKACRLYNKKTDETLFFTSINKAMQFLGIQTRITAAILNGRTYKGWKFIIDDVVPVPPISRKLRNIELENITTFEKVCLKTLQELRAFLGYSPSTSLTAAKLNNTVKRNWLIKITELAD